MSKVFIQDLFCADNNQIWSHKKQKQTRPQKNPPMSINLYNIPNSLSKRNYNSIISPSGGLEYDVLWPGHHALWLDVWLGHKLCAMATAHSLLWSITIKSGWIGDKIHKTITWNRQHMCIQPCNCIHQSRSGSTETFVLNNPSHTQQFACHSSAHKTNLTCHTTVSLQDQDSLDSIISNLKMFLSLFLFSLNTVDLPCLFPLLYSHLPPTQAPVYYLFNWSWGL